MTARWEKIRTGVKWDSTEWYQFPSGSNACIECQNESRFGKNVLNFKKDATFSRVATEWLNKWFSTFSLHRANCRVTDATAGHELPELANYYN